MREVLIIMIVSCVGAREKMMRVMREFEGKKTTSLSSSIIGTTTWGFADYITSVNIIEKETQRGITQRRVRHFASSCPRPRFQC